MKCGNEGQQFTGSINFDVVSNKVNVPKKFASKDYKSLRKFGEK